jgi:RHS repeat-associated protein
MTTGYDDAGRQTSVKATVGTTTLSSFTYSYQKNGADTDLRQSMTDPSGTTSYTYDGLNRLTDASGPGLTRTYGYDPNFNRTSKTENGTTTNYGYNAPNELTTVNGTNTYSYDPNGNLTGGAGWSLAYNAKDQTTSITKPGGSALSPLVYAGQGQTERTQAAATGFVNSALGVASATNAGSTDFYTRDNRGTVVSLRAASGSRYYYLFDGLGSVVGLVNSSGSKVNTYSYDPYGMQLSATEAVPNPWRYVGGYYDTQTALTKFGTRYCDPNLGRFTQRDPSGQDFPYAYAGCDPVNRIDPTGTCTVWTYVAGGLAGAVVGVFVASGGRRVQLKLLDLQYWARRQDGSDGAKLQPRYTATPRQRSIPSRASGTPLPTAAVFQEPAPADSGIKEVADGSSCHERTSRSQSCSRINVGWLGLEQLPVQPRGVAGTAPDATPRAGFLVSRTTPHCMIPNPSVQDIMYTLGEATNP